MNDLAPRLTPRRAQLLARLAAERAGLLLRLEGLDEQTLSGDAVFGPWTAAGLLAHLAYWEAFAGDRLARVAEGRLKDIQPLGGEDAREARNQTLAHRLSGIAFAEAVALCQKERRGFLLALGRLDDAMLERRVRLQPNWRVAPNRWAHLPYRHDMEHAAELVRWRATYPPNDPALRAIHPALLRPMLGLSRSEFLALAALVPPDKRETRALEGTWTLKQIIGHLSDYERLGVVALRALAAGREPIYERSIEDFEGYNEERGQIWAATSWDEAWATFIAARRALVEVAGGLDEPARTRPFISPWLTTTTACGYLLDMAGHEQEHSDALRRALDLPALPRRLAAHRA